MLRVRYDGGDCCGTACTGSKYRVDLLENENHEQGQGCSVLLLWTCVPFSGGWAGAQSNPHGATSSGNAASSERTEQQEMRDELKALRAEVDDCARKWNSTAGVSADDRGVLMPATTGGPNIPSVTRQTLAPCQRLLLLGSPLWLRLPALHV